MIGDAPTEELRVRAEEVSGLLRVLSHPNRLLIACNLVGGEQSVGEIENRTGVRQPTLSRELARLRDERLVETRRDAKQIFYRLSDPRVPRLIDALCRAFVPGDRPAPTTIVAENDPPGRCLASAEVRGSAFATVGGRTGRFRLKPEPILTG